MKNLKAAFIGLVLASLGFASVMASANSGLVAKPEFVTALPEMTIVGTVPSIVRTIPEIMIMGSLKPAKRVSKAHTVRLARVRVTDLAQGGAPGSESVTRIN